ncbi:acylneuraminate cytidylyltransferase family protein [uncultured Algimonas sp.]|uniref:acylneuraminate cytidylyltransferase family protein n=1 Tax=uncultured Algimonas sp. TaxID=1547920 RepID=UPI00260DABD3|nr:acylneuraminate cytidylyltransferase family protein [uncultured Algimonas sp.]
MHSDATDPGTSPNILVFVPARGGSKGIPSKNLQGLGNGSLLHWAVAIGQTVPDTMGVCVSTDHPDIAQAARDSGAEVLDRPDEISQDHSTVVEMLHYHLDAMDAEGTTPDIIVYLEPTSPFRTLEEIMACIAALDAGKLDAVATFQALSYHPSWLVTVDEHCCVQRLMPGRDAWNVAESEDASYALTGAVYVFRVSSFREARPKGIFFGKTGHLVQSSPAIDIDTPFELDTARGMLDYYEHPFFTSLGLIGDPG